MLRLSNLTEVMSDCNFTLVDANLALFLVFYLYGWSGVANYILIVAQVEVVHVTVL